MKLKLIILFIFSSYLFAGNSIFGQNIEQNLKKYWHYRDRLENEFMIVGMPNSAGTNWPARRRFIYNEKILGSGENPTYPFSEYLCILATEYRLLTDYGHEVKASETLQKIAWALQSFDRVDMNTEKFFKARADGIPNNAPNFWDIVDNYIEAEDLNGFFLRSDTEGDFLPGDWKCDRQNPDIPTYPANPDANLLNYNGEQLRYASEREIHHLESQLNSLGSVEANNRTVMSQDEVWSLLMGLAFINKFVDDPTLFTDLEDEQVTVRYWAKNITYRVVNYMRSAITPWIWRIKAPDDVFLVDSCGGNIWNCYGFAEAANEICGDDFGNLHDPRSLSSTNVFFSENLLLKNHMMYSLTKDWSPYGRLNLALIAGKKNFDYYYDLYSESSDFFEITSYERLPIVYALLHNKSLKNELGNDFNLYRDNFFYVLNQATDCGPFLKAYPDEVSSDYWWLDRWYDNKNFIIISPESVDYSVRQSGNGMDYMILHNLYWLGFLEPIKNSITIDQDYPYSYFDPTYNDWVEVGNDEFPVTISSYKTIFAENDIFEDGNVSYSAVENVILNSGFHSENGSEFHASISEAEYQEFEYIPYTVDCDYFCRSNFSAEIDGPISCAIGETVALRSAVCEGNNVPPYTYLWEYSYSSGGELFTFGTTKDVTITMPSNDLFLKLTVTDANNEERIDNHEIQSLPIIPPSGKDEKSDKYLQLEDNRNKETNLYDLGNVKFEIYPIPFNTNFELVLSDYIKANKLEIINISGEVIYSENLYNEQRKRIDGSTFSNGVYFVRVYTDKGLLFKKIIKQ